MTNELQFQVLDSLINAPSSVAGIYGDLVWLRHYDRWAIVDALETAIEGLEARGWVAVARVAPDGSFEALTTASRTACWEEYRNWLPNAEREELALDEVGVWCRVTGAGQAAWEDWSGQPGGQWQLDHDVGARRVTVEAATQQLADQILERWLSDNSAVALRKERKDVLGAMLRSGSTINRGVRVDCVYRAVEEQDPSSVD